MSYPEIFKCLRSAGCCDLCILRHFGVKNPDFYADPINAFSKLDVPYEAETVSESCEDDADDDKPSRKKLRLTAHCACCLGTLQETTWTSILDMAKSSMEDAGYDCDQFACSLSPPTCVFLREHSFTLFLQQKLPTWDADCVTSLKEAWKWSFGPRLARATNRELQSGAVCPFLINITLEHHNNMEELETLRLMSPSTFSEREKCHRKFRGEMFTRKSVETLVARVEQHEFLQHYPVPATQPQQPVHCLSVNFNHAPIYLAGRYCKFSRELCQTPWLLEGKRLMESSIQDIIFQPLLDFYKIPEDQVPTRLKFLSSGREDVDVRCLGKGRPFAVEIVDPKFTKLHRETLQALQDDMCRQPSMVTVTHLQKVNREELAVLKKGEETKTKTYLALCIKLPCEKNTSSDRDIKTEDCNTGNISNTSVDNNIKTEIKTEHCHTDITLNSNGQNEGSHCKMENISTAVVSMEDMEKLNAYSNTKDGCGVALKQKTPLRVLHRRPLLIRDRKVLSMKGALVTGKPNLFTVELTTQAGTYIKEFVHGDFGRTTPNLSEILGCTVDILALDVLSVNLDWPNEITDLK